MSEVPPAFPPYEPPLRSDEFQWAEGLYGDVGLSRRYLHPDKRRFAPSVMEGCHVRRGFGFNIKFITFSFMNKQHFIYTFRISRIRKIWEGRWYDLMKIGAFP